MVKKSIKRGEIYWVKLPLSSKYSKIRELQGPHPCLVVSNDEQNHFSPLITILPLTSSTDKIYPFQVLTKLKRRNNVILVDQIRTLDRKRFSERIGEVSIELMEEVEKALHITLALKT